MWNYLSFILLFKLGINVVDKKNDRMILISVSSFLESLRFFSKYVYLRFLDLEKYIIWIRTLGSNVKKAWLIEFNLEKYYGKYKETVTLFLLGKTFWISGPQSTSSTSYIICFFILTFLCGHHWCTKIIAGVHNYKLVIIVE